MFSTSHQKSSIEVLSTEAWELERLYTGGRNDSLESILLIRWHRGRDFLKQNKNKDQENNEEMILYYSPDGQILEYLHSISQAVNFVVCMCKSEFQVENKNQESL